MVTLNLVLGIIASILSISSIIFSKKVFDKNKVIEQHLKNELNISLDSSKKNKFSKNKAISGENGNSIIGDGNSIQGEMMVLGNNARSGDNGTSVVGNNNTFNTVRFDNQTPRILRRSAIFDICKIIAELDIEYDDEYSIQSNSDWMEKFDYNNVQHYVKVFDNYSDGYDEVSMVLNGYLKKAIMVKKIRTVYLEVENVREQENLDGDYVIKQVYLRLKEEVCYNDLINNSDLLDEEVDQAIYLIMFYVFTKCKLLKPVPKGEV